MRDIVINTGPIIALVSAAGSLDWLPSLYRKILIPFEVLQEIEAGGQGNPEILALNLIADRVIIGQVESEIPTALLRDLDTGEASVIANANLNHIDTVAIDEKSGRLSHLMQCGLSQPALPPPQAHTIQKGGAASPRPHGAWTAKVQCKVPLKGLPLH